ncbi:cell division protein FtsZ [Sphingopyxis sp.]|uniref:cell division protein FtsZ n=2 Tax=Sphingopyxis sp. TaxID=1908224 RepID=UPI003D11D836
MSINIGPPQVDELKPRIAVIGVGGAGGNAIANMIAARVEGVDFVVANTDAQALNASPAERRIQLGTQITQGLGAGSRPEVGRAAAEESIAQVEEALNGAHMCFVAAGMGGGTGTGAAPVIAKAARDRGILTVGVVTKPFTFEGNRRMRSAEAGIAELQDHVDTLIVIPNQNLFLVANPNTTFKEAFTMADEVLQQGVRGITDLMVMPGLINLDFADVRSVMREMGKAMMGTGEAEGDGRALEAAQKAIANPLLDGVSMAGAKGVIISITGGEDMRLMEVDEAANHIRELVDPDANIIWGSAFNDNLDGKIRVSVVATGIDGSGDAAVQPAPATRSFSFQPARTAAPAPVAEETVERAAPEVPVEAADEGDSDPTPGFSLGGGSETSVAGEAAQDEPMELSQVAATYDDTSDELVLSEPEAPVASSYQPSQAPAGEAAPHAAPAEDGPARAVGGGTLFERMSRLSRGSATEREDAKEDGVDIPRFLGRQNNQ